MEPEKVDSRDYRKKAFMKNEFTLSANKIHKLRNALECADVPQFIMQINNADCGLKSKLLTYDTSGG